MNQTDKVRLADAYIERFAQRVTRTPDNVFVENDLNPWVLSELRTIEKENPELLWELIQLILTRTNNKDVEDAVLCGPLENLLKAHETHFMDRVDTFLAQRGH